MDRKWLVSFVVVVFVGLLSAQNWDFPVKVYNGSRSSNNTIRFGVAAGATDGYNTGYDVLYPYPGMPGFKTYFVAPSTAGFVDTLHPYLTKDVRNALDAIVLWVGRVEGDETPYARKVSWNKEDLLELTGEGGGLLSPLGWIDSIIIGARNIGSSGMPSVWFNMLTEDSITFAPTQEFVIRAWMVGAIDYFAPVVVGMYPADGASAVPRDVNVLFSVLDDVSGVDISTVEIGVSYNGGASSDITDECTYIPAVGSEGAGYTFTWTHGSALLPETTNVCIIVSASDFEGHNLNNFMWCFSTQGEVPVDLVPPMFSQWSTTSIPFPAFGDGDTVPIMDTIYIKVEDGQSGVDTGTIEVLVDSVPAPFTARRIETFLDYIVAVPPTEGGWGTDSWHEVSITACDLAGNCVGPETRNFYVSSGMMSDWFMNITLWSGSEYSTLTFGEKEGASEGCDPYDAVQPGLPGFYAYFPIFCGVPDTAYSVDMRPRHIGQETWVIRLENPTTDCRATWNPLAVPDPGGDYSLQLWIAHGPDEGNLSTPIRMDLYNSLDISCANIVVITAIYGTGVTGCPRVQNRRPAPGETGVNIALDTIYFDIIDDAAVDLSSVLVTLNDGTGPTNITSLINFMPVSGGYRAKYHPPLGLIPSRTYTIYVYACDSDPVPNCCDYQWSFTTATACGPSFTLSISIKDSTATGIMTSSVTVGANDSASSGFSLSDPDGILPPAPGFQAWVSTALTPPYDKLFQDVRWTCEENVWKIDFGYEGTGGGHGTNFVYATWNSSAVFVDPLWELLAAVGSPTTPPPDAAYQSMRTVSRLNIPAGQVLYVKYKHIVPEGYTISGTVTDWLGSPLGGVLVTVGGWMASTDTLGQYSIAGIPPGTYWVRATKTGYDPESTQVTITTSDVVVDFELMPTSYVVSGTASVNGEPTGGITITIGSQSDVSEADGSYSIRIPAGTWPVSASYPGYPEYNDTITVSDDMDYDINILPGTFIVCGTVTSAGAPVEGVQILVDGSPSATTDTAGNYCVNTAYGAHTFIARKAGYSDAIVYEFIANDTTINFVITPAPVQICFRVMSSAGGPVSGAQVTMSTVGSAVTTSEGYACFANVPWGTYNVDVTASHFASLDTNIVVSEPDTIQLTLRYFCPPTNLQADTESVARPLPRRLRITLRWRRPNCSEDGYKVYRNSILIGTLTSATDTFYIDSLITADMSYRYCVEATYGTNVSEQVCSPVVASHSLPDPHMILAVDYDDGAGFSEDVAEELDGIDLEDDYTMTLQNENIYTGWGKYVLADYQAIIVVLGIQDGSDTPMPTDMQTMLNSYTGLLYVMGPDFAQNYSGTALLTSFRFTGTQGAPQSTGNVQYLKLNGAYFQGDYHLGMNYAYRTSADHYVDELTPLAGTEAILFANADSMIVGTRNGLRVYTSIYPTACSWEMPPMTATAGGRIIGGILWQVGIANTSVREVGGKKPLVLSLDAIPNPFNAWTTINFSLPAGADVNLAIHDVTGRLVKTLHSGYLDVGNYSTNWDASNVPAGIYFVKLNNGMESIVVKIYLVK